MRMHCPHSLTEQMSSSTPLDSQQRVSTSQYLRSNIFGSLTLLELSRLAVSVNLSVRRAPISSAPMFIHRQMCTDANYRGFTAGISSKQLCHAQQLS